MSVLIRKYLELTKPKIIYLLLITALGGLFIASETLPKLWLSITVLAGGSLAAGGANAINHYLDRDIDKKMTRTSKRPVASGAIKPIYALVFGISLNVFAFLILWKWGNFLSASLTLSATLFYVFIYTMILKRRTPQNIVIGGAAGSIPPVVGWAAVNGTIMAAGIEPTKKQIFAYTWILLVITVLLTVFSKALGLIYGITSIALTIGFIVMAWRLMNTENITFAKPTYLYSLAYLALLFLLIMVDSYV